MIVFGTVGFGDIAASESLSRMIVSLQIILDLLLLGFGLRVFFDAAKLARSRQADDGS